MSKRKAKAKKAVAANPANLAMSGSAMTAAQIVDAAFTAGTVTANPATVAELAVTEAPTTTAAPMTMAELIAEHFPNGALARMAGGMAIALQRELRRRNRMTEKGY